MVIIIQRQDMTRQSFDQVPRLSENLMEQCFDQNQDMDMGSSQTSRPMGAPAFARVARVCVFKISSCRSFAYNDYNGLVVQ